MKTIDGYDFKDGIIREVNFSDNEIILRIEKKEEDGTRTYNVTLTPEYHYSRCGDVERYISSEIYMEQTEEDEAVCSGS